MDCEFLIVSSITYAMKAKKELEGQGIPCKVEKLRQVKALGGCGYGIRVGKDVSALAGRVLSLAGIRVISRMDCGERV